MYDAWINGYTFDNSIKISKYGTRYNFGFRVANTVGSHMLMLCALEANTHVNSVFMLSEVDSLVIAQSSSYSMTITKNADADFTIIGYNWSTLLVIDFSVSPNLTTVSIV